MKQNVLKWGGVKIALLALSSVLVVPAQAQVLQRTEAWYDPTTWDWPKIDPCQSPGGNFDIGNRGLNPSIGAMEIGLDNQPQVYQYIHWEVRNGYIIDGTTGASLGTSYNGLVGRGIYVKRDDNCVNYMEVRGWAMHTGVGGVCGDKYDAVGITFIQTPGYVNDGAGISMSHTSVTCGTYASASLPWYSDTKYEWYLKAPNGVKTLYRGVTGQNFDLNGKLNMLGTYEISAVLSPTNTVATPNNPNACTIWGNQTKTAYITATNRLATFSIPTQSAGCDQNLNISAPAYNDVNYTWNIPNASYNGAPSQNANIKYFEASGSFNASCTITPSNGSCGAAVSSSFMVNVTPKTAGPLLDNNSGLAVGTVYPSPNGLYSLRLQQLINSASYVWELPDGYSLVNGTPTVSKKIKTETTGQISDLFPINSLVDFNGKVTSTGSCGSQVFNFTIKARQTASVPSLVPTCDLSTFVYINNPNNDIIDAVWVEDGAPATVSKYGNNAVLVRITDGGESVAYKIGIQLRNVGSFTSSVIYREGSGVWGAGTLADERRDLGSNLALSNNRELYFTTRDGKMWYYEFSNGLAKWDALPVPAVTNARVVANGYSDVQVFNYYTGIVVYYLTNSNEIYKAENGSAIPFSTSPTTKLHRPRNSSYATYLFFRKTDGNISYIDKTGNVLATNINNTDDERFLVENSNIYYVKAGYIYQATVGNVASETQLVVGKAILPGTDLEISGVHLYFTGIDKVLYRVNRSTKVLESLTIAGYCEGQFTINPETNVVYVKTKDPNSIYFRVGQVYLQSGAWLVKNATNSTVNRPHDYADGDIVFSKPNVFYVSAKNKLSKEGESINSVWNLYYYDECTPTVFRKGDVENAESINGSQNADYVAYPNPIVSQLTVQASQQVLDGSKVALFDALGRKVAETEMLGGNAAFATSQLQSGIYIVKVYEADKVVYTQKVAK